MKLNPFVSLLMVPFSFLYGTAVALRNWLYNRGIKVSHRLDCRVISVGNLSVGGTGKTPMVECFARRLHGDGRGVAILSRGYRGKGKGTVIVSDGVNLLVDDRYAGDEPYLLASRLRSVPIIVNRDRVKGAEEALHRFHSKYLILDDGFQYRRLQRDLDVVLVDFQSSPQRLLPAGPLREPWRNLRRADLIFLTKCPLPGGSNWELVAGQKDFLRQFTEAPIVACRHHPVKLVDVKTREDVGLKILHNRKVVAFAGIANPASFRLTLLDEKSKVVKFFRFPDHYRYGTKDIKRIFSVSSELEGDLVVTTEKDRVRLPREFDIPIPLYFLVIEIEILEEFDVLKALKW